MIQSSEVFVVCEHKCTCISQEILHDKINKKIVMKEDPFEVYERKRDCNVHGVKNGL